MLALLVLFVMYFFKVSGFTGIPNSGISTQLPGWGYWLPLQDM